MSCCGTESWNKKSRYYLLVSVKENLSNLLLLFDFLAPTLVLLHTVFPLEVELWVSLFVMWGHLVLTALAITSVSALPGIDFGDNAGQKYLTDQNGVAIAISKVTWDRGGGMIMMGCCHYRSPVSWHSAPGSTLSGGDGTHVWGCSNWRPLRHLPTLRITSHVTSERMEKALGLFGLTMFIILKSTTPLTSTTSWGWCIY